MYTGEKFDFGNYAEKMLGKDRAAMAFPEKLARINRSLSKFFGAEIKAINSERDYDIIKYGSPSPERIIPLLGDFDYTGIFLTLANMMLPKKSHNGKILLLNDTASNATYFGADVLRRYLMYFGDPGDKNFSNIMDSINPSHVCTTSVLQLIESAVGEDKCRDIAKAVIRENNLELVTVGLPLVDFTHHFASVIAKEYLLSESLKSGHKLSSP